MVFMAMFPTFLNNCDDPQCNNNVLMVMKPLQQSYGKAGRASQNWAGLSSLTSLSFQGRAEPYALFFSSELGASRCLSGSVLA